MKILNPCQVHQRPICLCLLGMLLVHFFTALSWGQGPTRTQSAVAVSGQPFGVLAVEVPLPANWDGRSPRILLNEDTGRLFYPVVTTRTTELSPVADRPLARIGRPGGLIDRVRGALRPTEVKSVPTAIQIYGLFLGDAPLQVSLSGDINQRIEFIVDSTQTVAHRKLLDLWWQSYVQSASTVVGRDDAPKLVQYYLTSMLARRFSLPFVDLDPPPEDEESNDKNQLLETLSLLAAIEPLREEILERVLREPLASVDEVPVPKDPLWQVSSLPPAPDATIESIATRIPPECFYLRFGSFNNYVWFQELAARFGGDVSQAVFLRGFNYEASARLERMLATKLTAVAKMFGDKLISDLAVFGSDLYLTEGASMGVIFQSSNPGLLRTAMETERKAVLSKNPDARLQEISIGGSPVSLLSTPDNQIRSFLAFDGKYVLVTTSRHLVQRFLQVGQGEPSLATTESFRLARSWMPELNNYTVFGYFSPEFFQRLVSPQYQIELRRRLEAVAHLEIAEIASLAATAEGVPQDSIEQLKQHQLVPPWYDQRADGSRVLRSGNRWIDSERGARGSFLPISDVKIASVSTSEAAEYARIAQFYQQQWQRMDPLLVGIRRFERKDGEAGETVAVEAHIAPFEPKKYGWIADQLAEPGPIEIQLPKDDAAAIQLRVRNKQTGEPYYLFGGVKDMMPPEPEEVQGLIKSLRALKAAPAYIGAWPKPGLIEQLPLGLGAALGRPDINGFSWMIGGLWRWQDEQWSLLSFDRQILNGAIPQLATAQSTDEAQVRATIANLQGSQLARWVNSIWWERGWRTSHGNAELLDGMHQQLKVPTEQCLSVAERLLDAKLQCPLGGEYVLEDTAKATRHTGWWISTAWHTNGSNLNGQKQPAADYSAPWIRWFRGGKVQATQQSNSLSVVGAIHMELPTVQIEANKAEASGSLPSMDFDLFSLPMKMFGKGAAKDKSNQPPAAPVKKSF